MFVVITRALSICPPVKKKKKKGCAQSGCFPQSEDRLINHGCVAHLFLLTSKYSVQVCRSHWKQQNELESAVLLKSVLQVVLLANEKKKNHVGCLLWIWLHIPVVLLSFRVSFCFASVVLSCLHIVCLFVICGLCMQMQTNMGWQLHCKLGVEGRLGVLFHPFPGLLSLSLAPMVEQRTRWRNG